MGDAEQDAEAAQKLYDDILKDVPNPTPDNFDAHRDAIPTHQYGKTEIMDMPLVSLGGFVPLAMTLFHNRRLRCFTGCRCKAKTWVVINALAVPFIAAVLAVVFLPQETLLPDWCSSSLSQSEEPNEQQCSEWFATVWPYTQYLLVLVGIVIYETVAMAILACCEHPYHNKRTLDYSYAIGVNHVETARHYMESEAQLRPLLKAQESKGNKWIVQTKIRCYAVEDDEDHRSNRGALYKTALESLKTLGRPAENPCGPEPEQSAACVDMLTIHGVNIKSHVATCLQKHGSIDQADQLKQDRKCKAVGFAGHCHTNDIIKIIETGRMDYVNLHFGFFSSCARNSPALLFHFRLLGWLRSRSMYRHQR